MSFQTWATEKIQELFASFNTLKDDSKSIDELDEQTSFDRNAKIPVSVSGTPKKMALSKINSLLNADGDTGIEVEQSADDDAVNIKTGGVTRLRVLPDGTVEVLDGRLIHTTPDRIYDSEGWFMSRQSGFEFRFLDDYKEFWSMAYMRDRGWIGADNRRHFEHGIWVRRSASPSGNSQNPNIYYNNGYGLHLMYLPFDGEGENYGLPDHVLAKLQPQNTYFAIGSWGPTNREANEKMGVYGGAFVEGILRAGGLKLEDINATTIMTHPTLLLDEATGSISTSFVGSLQSVTLQNATGDLRTKIKHDRMIIVGYFVPTNAGSAVLIGNVGYFSPNITRRMLVAVDNEDDVQTMTIADNGDIRVNVGAHSGKTFVVDAEFTIVI